MGAHNIKMVAMDVSEALRKGEIINLGKIMMKNGYKKSSSLRPSDVTRSKSYKEVVDPVIEALARERNAILKRLPQVRAKAKYRDLIDGLDKTTKNMQLLQGKETSKENITFTWEK